MSTESTVESGNVSTLVEGALLENATLGVRPQGGVSQIGKLVALNMAGKAGTKWRVSQVPRG